MRYLVRFRGGTMCDVGAFEVQEGGAWQCGKRRSVTNGAWLKASTELCMVLV